MNVCCELRCPLFDRRRGCSEFISALHCPLGYLLDKGNGIKNPEIIATEYWLTAEDDADLDISALRQRLETEVLARSCRLKKCDET